MDYSSKWLVGIATSPYIILSFFVGEKSSAMLTFACFCLSTIGYSLIIIKAKPDVQRKRFIMFSTFQLFHF